MWRHVQWESLGLVPLSPRVLLVFFFSAPLLPFPVASFHSPANLKLGDGV